MTDLMTLAEVAEATRTTVDTVRTWRKVGKGPRAAKIGRRVMYRRADVEAWIAAQFEADGRV